MCFSLLKLRFVFAIEDFTLKLNTDRYFFQEFGLISHSKLLGACQIVGITFFNRLRPLFKLIFFSLIEVKNNNYAFQQEFPYRIPQILEAEFFLLEMMVRSSVIALL